MRTLLRHATIVTMNPLREIKEGHDLLLEDDRIAKIAPEIPLDQADVDTILECRAKIIIPGLISAHSHFTGMFQRGLWDDNTFESWFSNSNAVEKRLNFSAEDIYTIHCAACIEFIRHGVTTAVNMFTVSPGYKLEKVESSCNAILDSGLRGILAVSLTPNDNASLSDPASPASLLDFARDAAKRVAGLKSRLGFMLAPSAPQRCSDQFLISCGKLAADLDVCMHTHLSETKLHAETARTIYGEPMVTHLKKIGLLNSKLSMAHSIWLEDEEIDLLGEYGVKVVHNPACNMKLGDGVAQVKKMLEKGISVGLGSDSVNAGTVYSVFEQMKLSVLLPRAVWGRENWILPAEAFEMGCLGGARVVLQDKLLGSIEEGKKADLAILNPSTSLLPMNNLINQMALCENGNSVETVFVDGRAVMLEKQIQTVDEAKILAKLSSFRTSISGAYKEVLEKKGANL